MCRSNVRQITQAALNRQMMKAQRILDTLKEIEAELEIPCYCQRCGAFVEPEWRSAYRAELTVLPGNTSTAD